MTRARFLPLILAMCLAFSAWGQVSSTSTKDKVLTIEAQVLGDVDEGVAARVTFRYRLEEEMLGSGVVIQGSILQGGEVLRNFRHPVRPTEPDRMEIVQRLPAGTIEIEARLLIERETGIPFVVAKETAIFEMNATGSPYVAEESDGADAIIAEGVIPTTSGLVSIRPPRRDLAPNLFIVDVDVRPPAERIEFWIDGRKIMTKNAPPYRAELNLGSIPRRVEVRVVAYDARGRYVDADAWVVNERETPLEVKITRTVTRDGMNHFRVSLQNPRNVPVRSVSLQAGEQKLVEWKSPPYALDLPGERLATAGFVSATAVTADGYEASDLLYLDGDRYIEQIEVNLVELPVTVIDDRGVPILDLQRAEVSVFEDEKAKTISDFAFSDNLPLSLGVLVDHSGSMEKRIEEARAAAIGFFEQILREDDRGFFGGFSWETTSLSPLVSDLGTLQRQVAEMPPAVGGTALYDAIVSGLYRFRTVPGRKALVIVTDGVDTASRIPYDEMLTYVRVSRVPIYFIGIGISKLDFKASSTLRNLAAETGGVAYFVKNVEDLSGTYDAIEKELRSQYLISYYTESTKRDNEYRLVRVETSRQGAKVRTIRGFIP